LLHQVNVYASTDACSFASIHVFNTAVAVQLVSLWTVFDDFVHAELMLLSVTVSAACCYL